MKRISAAIMAILVPLAGQAVVDMKNSNYNESAIDLTVPGSAFDLKVQRFYNSRSLINGMFGFGWCTDFETSLTQTPEGSLKYQECGAGQEIIYTRGKADSKTIDEVTEKIIAYVKKTNRSATPQLIERLQDQLRNYPDVREHWAKQAQIPTPKLKKDSVFTADTLQVEKIRWDGVHFIRVIADGNVQKFNKDGKLESISDKNGNYLKYVWRGDLLKEVIDNNGRKLSFQHAGKRVKKVTGPKGLKVEYKYNGEDIVYVKTMWNNVITYAYDDNHNLTRINFPDKTFKALTYDKARDLVLSFTDRAEGGVTCTEKYTYEMSKDDPRNHFWSTATRKCGKVVKNESRFEFWHKVRPDGGKYLYRVLTKSNSDTLDVTYHPAFGRPLSIRKNGVLTTFAYFPNGLVKEKSTQNTKLTYEYKNKFNKVSKVVTQFYDQKLKPVRKRETVFEYDDKANLRFAKNSDGQTVRLSYDTRGRIATIVDQAKKEVHIAYDDRTNKPVRITRPKVGSIVVTYKNNEMKADSKDGPAVAVQVASTFNNLLDIIAPATSELNL